MKHPFNHSRSGIAVLRSILFLGLLCAFGSSLPSAFGFSQESTVSGEVVSSTRNTVVVKSDAGRFELFVFDRDTVKPRTLAVASKVRVVSSPGDESGVRVASEIVVLEAPPAAAPGTAARPPQTVPREVRRTERDIERQARRYQMGVRAGIALDPELILLGVQAQMGPVASKNIYVRPGLEFAFGEVTTLFAFNLEAIYRLPASARQGGWAPYAGLGPSLSFTHQNFERTSDEGRKIDFGDFGSDVGLNILGGVRNQKGVFIELKSSVYARPSPTLRLMVGYSF